MDRFRIQRRYRLLKKRGLCVASCGRKALKGRVRCVWCLVKQNELNRKRVEKFD